MEASKSPAQVTQTGERELTLTEKRILVSARDVMATILDAQGQARRAGLQTASKTYERNGRKVVVMAIAIPGFDVVAEGGSFLVAGRAITKVTDWMDLVDVMASPEEGAK